MDTYALADAIQQRPEARERCLFRIECRFRTAHVTDAHGRRFHLSSLWLLARPSLHCPACLIPAPVHTALVSKEILSQCLLFRSPFIISVCGCTAQEHGSPGPTACQSLQVQWLLAWSRSAMRAPGTCRWDRILVHRVSFTGSRCMTSSMMTHGANDIGSTSILLPKLGCGSGSALLGSKSCAFSLTKR